MYQKGHWAYEAIHELAEQEIILGYGDGIFGFGDNVTREQVAALIYRVFDMEEQDEYENPYGDIDENSTSFIEEILALTEMGIFQGDENGNFRPKATLTRAEMAQVLTNAFDLQARDLITLMMFQQIHGQRMQLVQYKQMVLQWESEKVNSVRL